ncbi:MAG: AcrR family transcriptional regulator [Candidatus Azotimanducaceae bacterium]|jgi:AcrR family transcriptional regulator
MYQMTTKVPTKVPTKVTNSRRPQQRAAETRNVLLQTAIEMFTTQGFEGVSIRALELAAGVQRGAVAYHFDKKEALWKAAINRLLERFAEYVDPLQAMMADLNEEARLRAMIATTVRFAAQTPEFNRLMVQEGRSNTWRLQYLMDNFIRARFAWLDEMVGLVSDPHAYYIALGASTLVFDVDHECRELFGVDPTTDVFIREHADRVADVILHMRHSRSGREIA